MATDKKLSRKDEKEIVELLDDYFQQALDDPSWREAREEMIRCFDYKENRQWTKQELAALAERGQPPTVDNQIAVTIDRIVGQFVQMKMKTTYKPRNGDLDAPVANVMSDIYTYIRQCSGLEFEERECMEDGATGGFGVLEVLIEDGPLGDKEVKVRAEDCFNVFPDPKSRRYDWNEDARYICRAKWVDKQTLIDLYPAKKAKINGLFTDSGNTSLSNVDALRGESYIDYERERIRLVEVQYKKTKSTEKYLFSDGKTYDDDEVDDKLLSMADEAGVTYETSPQRKEHICVGVFTAGVLFEHGVSKRKRYSFIPFFVNRKKNGAPYSKVTTSIPLQDSINKRKSKALSLLTLNQTIAEEGGVKDIATWKEESKKADGFLEVEQGYFEKVRIDKNLELAQTQNQMYMEDKQSFRQVTGINPDAMGEKSEVRSGVGIQRKVAMTGLVVAPLFDNFKRTREALAKTIHDAVCISYTADKVLTITDNPKLTRSVTLDNDSLEAVKQTHYDVIISEEQDFETVNEQQQEMLSRSLPQMLQFGPAWAEILFEMSDLRNKDEILTKVQQITQQNAPKQPHTIAFSAQLDKLTAIERAWHYQQMGMDPLMIQQMLAQTPPPTQVLDAQNKIGAEQVKAQSEQLRQQGDLANERTKQETMQLKAHTDQQSAVMKLQTEQMKQKVEEQKMMMDLAKQRASMEMDIEKAQRMPEGGNDGKRV